MADDPRSGVTFESLVWHSDRIVALSYWEEGDAGTAVSMIRTLRIDVNELPDHYPPLVEALSEFLNQAWVVKRSPPEITTRYGG